MRSLRLFVLVRLAIVASTGAARADEIFVTNNDVGPTLSTRLRLHHLGGYGEPALISGLHLPNGIAVSGSNRFVANNGEAGPVGGTGTIGEYTTSGATVNPTLVSGLSFPSGIAVVPTVPEPIAASHLHSSDSFLRNSIRMTQNAPKKLLDYRVGTRPRRADHRKAWPLSRRPLAQGLTMIRGRIVGISDEWYEFRNGIPRSSDN